MGVDVQISFSFLKAASHSPSHTIAFFFLDAFPSRLDNAKVGDLCILVNKLPLIICKF